MKLLLFLNNDMHAAKVLWLLHDDFRDHEVRIILSRQVGRVVNLVPQLLEMKAREAFNIEKNFPYRCDFYDNVNSTTALQDIAEFAPDLMISVRFGQIMQAPLIAIPRFGVINLHSGILPQYRGVMASFWAILSGEKTLGTTLHYIEDKTIDTGRTIAITNRMVDYNSSLIENIHNLYDDGAQLILQFLRDKSCDNKTQHQSPPTLLQAASCKSDEDMGNKNTEKTAVEKIVSLANQNSHQSRYFSYPQLSDVEQFVKIMPLF